MSSSDVGVNIASLPICATCRSRTLPTSRWKNCDSCRLKRTTQQREYGQRKMQKMMQISQITGEVGNLSESTSSGVKRKAGDLEDDYGLGGMMDKARKRLKGNNLPLQSSNLNVVVPSPSVDKTTEYQTATELYKTLDYLLHHHAKPGSASGLTFKGCYSIVAKLDVDEIKRVKLVVADLRKLAKLSFDPNELAISGNTFTFKCRCYRTARSNPAVLATGGSQNLAQLMASTSAPLKGKQQDLNVSVGSQGSAVSSAENVIVNCRGLVTVSAEKDNSHVLGIKGQKISVTVQH